jgi:hypothetical protein
LTTDRARDRHSLAIEHLQNALQYSRRGRDVFFDDSNPDTLRLIEGELRKAFESLNRQGDAFFHSNPKLPRDRIGEIRQFLTHDYAELDSEEIWRLVTVEAPRLLRQLARAKIPK